MKKPSLVSLFLLLGVAHIFAATPDRPNLVIMISDDHSLADSSVYGSTDVKTPNMQRIADAGLVFDRAFVASPSCAPSRAAMLTGLMPARNGAEPNHSHPKADIRKLPAYLQSLGYEVVAFGKVSHYKQTSEYGFDHWGYDSFHDDIAILEGLRWLRTRKSSKPLCIFFGSNWPHTPWPTVGGGYVANEVTLPPNLVDTPRTRQYRTRYYAAIAQMDAELGAVYDVAYDLLGANTFFLHTSDHGASWPFGKWNCYDSGIRTPMIAVWPGKLKPGTRTPAMVSWIDILPTLVEIGGGKAPLDIDGKSFLPVLSGKTDEHRDRIFTTHSADGDKNVYPIRSVRTADWKYIHNLNPDFYYTAHVDLSNWEDGFFKSWVEKSESDTLASSIVHRYHVRPAEELYDLRVDPLEMNNLAGDPAQADRVAGFRAEVDGWMKSNGDTGKVYGQPRLVSDFKQTELPTSK